MKIVLAALILAVCVSISRSSSERPFLLTLKVVDDGGRPVEGAEVGVTYENLKIVDGPEHFVTIKMISDDRGNVTLGGAMFLSRIAYGATKAGYYQTIGLEYLFSNSSRVRWEPWNPSIELLIKRIRDPMPMYAKRVATGLPVLDTSVGYDLEVGDWLPPQGKGRTADMIFVGELSQRAPRDWELSVSFSNPGDGLQRFEPGSANGGSELRSPHEAPVDGYLSSLTLVRSRRPDLRDQTTFNEDGGYFFRVRTELDAKGHVVKAWYGKIYGDFFDMVYYLNPDGTRNVEFDPKRNLFPHDDRDRAFWNLTP